MKNSSDLFHRYLKILKTPLEAPSLEYLQKLVQAQLHFLPYENISKILRLKNQGPGIPTLEEFITANEEYGFGGTCFVQNGYFVELLRWLGFQAELIGVGFSPEFAKHPSCRIHLKDRSYLVDLGNFTSFAGPFPLVLGTVVEGRVGDWSYRYEAGEGLTHSMQSFRDGKAGRTWRSHAPARELSFFEQANRESFEKDATFMTTIAAHRLIDGNPTLQWGPTLVELRKGVQKKTKLENLDQLEAAFAEVLGLAKYPVREAVEFLQKWNQIDFFKDI